MPPSVSIVIPTKNRPIMLYRAVVSAVKALPEDGEIIVVDDNSSAPAEESLKRIDDPRIKVLRNPARGGSSARNFGFESASGEVLFFLDDDDEMLPHYCAEVIKSLQSSDLRPDFGFCAQEIIQAADGVDKEKKIRRRPGLKDGIVDDATPFKLRTFPFSIGLWMTRDTFQEVGPIDETMATNSDTEYSCRLFSARKRQWYSSRPGVRIHFHNGAGSELNQVTHRTPASTRAAAFRTIMVRHAQWLREDNSARRFLLSRYSKLCAKAGMPLDFPDTRISLMERSYSRGEYLVHRLLYGVRGRLKP